MIKDLFWNFNVKKYIYTREGEIVKSIKEVGSYQTWKYELINFLEYNLKGTKGLVCIFNDKFFQLLIINYDVKGRRVYRRIHLSCCRKALICCRKANNRL